MYVAMFHSVGNEKSPWHRHWLSVSIEHLETLCQYFVDNGYTTYTLEEWYDYFSQPRKKNRKQLVLTFDDGYLDNWVFAYPILKKYGLKGTIFINPEFVEHTGGVRPNLEDVWQGKTSLDSLTTLGFLNWEELRAMQRSGVMDIQSHSMSHNSYFHSHKVVDIYTGQPRYDWISWYLEPQNKPFAINIMNPNPTPMGYPVFEYGRALGLTRYFPDKVLIEKSIGLYNSKGYGKGELIEGLQSLTEQYPGRYETPQEVEERYRYELFESKTILERELGKPVDFLCWPGGGYNDFAVELSKEAGYKASTWGSSDRNRTIEYNAEYKRIPRFGLGSFIRYKKGFGYATSDFHLVNTVRARTGNIILRIWMKLKKEVINVFK